MKYCFFILFSMLSSTILFGQRDTIQLNDVWKFKIDLDGKGITDQWYLHLLDNSKEVHLPHTWNIEDKNQNHYGWGWYQRKLFIPANWKSKNLVLEFGAINHTSIVFLNGVKISENTGDGFNQITVNLNGKLLYGKENTITVAVNNAYNQHKVPFGTSFDWPNDGGIIRPVKLIVSNKPSANYLHVTPVLVTACNEGKLNIRIGFEKQEDIELEILVQEENQPTSNIIYKKVLQPGWVNHEAITEILLNAIHPWHFDFPNLYKVKVAVLNKKKVVDVIAANIGFRELKFSNGQTYLNGERIKLMGVEWTAGSNPDFGFAESDSLIIAMGKLMKQVNCIFSRQHFQQGDVFYDFCDRNGILVQQEVPLWGPETPANDTIQKIAERQLKTMIHTLYNHPSIFSWGVGNELRARDKDMKTMISHLLAYSRSLDPSRSTAYVSNTLTRSFYNQPDFVPDAASEGDYLMMNEYGGSWWPVSQGSIGNYIDSVHLSYPNMPFFISEFGLCEPNFKGGDERRIEDIIYHMAIYESKPYIDGAIYFDLTDYRTHYPGTIEENKYRRRIHGVYDMYGTPKPSMKILREYSSPVELLGFVKGNKGKTYVKLIGNIGLPQYIVKGYKLYVSDRTDNYATTKAYDIPEIKPGQIVLVEVDTSLNSKDIITVVRPLGFIATQKKF